MNLQLFFQFCVFHHNKVVGMQSDSVTINTIGQQQQYKKLNNFPSNEDGLLGKVWIGNTRQLICVPHNSALTIPGRPGKNIKIPSGTSCFVDTTAVNNLPWGISAKYCLGHPKGNAVLVIIMNQNNQNDWIWQPLVSAETFWVEHFHGIMG